jgi:hypothetical protein
MVMWDSSYQRTSARKEMQMAMRWTQSWTMVMVEEKPLHLRSRASTFTIETVAKSLLSAGQVLMILACHATGHF